MELLDGALANVFGAAFAPLYADGLLRKRDGSADIPAKILVEAATDEARAASGLPATSVTIILLAARLAAEPDLDDLVVRGSRSYRILRRDLDPAGAAWRLAAVPA